MNPFPNRFDSECANCGGDIYEEENVFADDGEFICEDCAAERNVICECGNYKKAGFPTCFDCKDEADEQEDADGNFSYKP